MKEHRIITESKRRQSKEKEGVKMHMAITPHRSRISKLLRNVFSFILAAAFLFPIFLIPASALYTDVPSTHWAYTYVNNVTNRGIMGAYSGNYFRPTYTMTRLAAVTCLGKLAGVPINNNVSSPFTDLPSGTAGLGYARWAKNNNIINGTSATTFSPNQVMNKESFAVMIYNFLVAYNHSYTRSSVSSFNDQNDISSWAQEAVSVLHSAGLVSGDGSNNFNPDNSITRAEAAVVFSRIPSSEELTNGIYKIRNASSSLYMNVRNISSNNNGLNTTENNRIVMAEHDDTYGAQYFRFTQDLGSGRHRISPLCSYYAFYRQFGVSSVSAGSEIMTVPSTSTSYYKDFILVKVAYNLYQFVPASNTNLAIANVNGRLKLQTRNVNDDKQRWIVYPENDLNNAEILYRSYKWVNPLPNSNYILSSSFGYREYNGYNMHSGVDIIASNGTNVYAVTDGVIFKDYKNSLGNYIELTPSTDQYAHSSNSVKLKAAYLHLSNVTVSHGATVTKGQKIGETGDTGSPGAYHLHFGVITDGGSAYRNGSFNYFTYPHAFFNRYIWSFNYSS